MREKVIFLITTCVLLVLLSCKNNFSNNKPKSSSSTASTTQNAAAFGGSSIDFSKEDLFTGTVAFSVPITSIGGVNVALNYSSNVHKLVRAGNNTSQSGWTGIGWSLNLGTIVGDIKGTKDVSDDHYYYVSASGSSELVQISGNSFALKNYQYWTINRNLDANGNLIGWTIVTQDGTIMRFGNYDKSQGQFIFNYGYTNATRFSLGWGGLITNPINTNFNSGDSLISYQWDLSDVQDVAGNHTTIAYQQINNTLSVNGYTTSLQYTQESYPYTITDRTGKYVKFVLGTLQNNEYLAPPDKIIQRQLQTEFLDHIDVFNSNNSLIQRIQLGYSDQDIFGQNDYKKYLSSIINQDANLNPLPSTKFDYYATSGNLGANPGALYQITYPSGGTVQYTYQYQTLSNVSLSPNPTYNWSTNAPVFDNSIYNKGMSGSDFYVVQLADGSLEVYRFGETGWYLDNSFPNIGSVYSYQVFGDYVVFKTSSTNIEVVKRQEDSWTAPYTVNLSQTGSADSVEALSSNFFVIAHNPANNAVDVSVVRFSDGQWNTQYVGNFSDDLTKFMASTGENFFVMRLNTMGIIPTYYPETCNWNGTNWTTNALTLNSLAAIQLYAGPDYLIALDNPGNDGWNALYVWKRNGTSWSNSNQLSYYNNSSITGIYPANNFFVAQEFTSTVSSTLVVSNWNGDSNNNGGWTQTNLNVYPHPNVDAFPDNGQVNVAVGNNYIAIGSVNPTNYVGSLLICQLSSSISNSWSGPTQLDQRQLTSGNYWESLITPLNNGSTLFAEWFQYFSGYQNIKAYTRDFDTWNSFGSLDDVPVGNSSNGGLSFTQPGNGFVADIIDPQNGLPVSSDVFMQASGTSGAPLFTGAPGDYPVSTKIINDGMGHSYTTTFTFSNGVYNENFSSAEYNEATVTPPDSNGKTVTYFYNKLGSGQAVNFINVPDYLNLDGFPYKTEIYNQSGSIIASTTNYWHASSINNLTGVYYRALDSVQVMKDGVTRSTSYIYNSTNGLASEISENVEITSDLYGERNRVTDITYGFQQNTAMQTANMLSQIYENKIISSGVTPNASITAPSDGSGPSGEGTAQFTCPFTQTVSYKITNGSNGYMFIGTSPGGSDVVPITSSNGRFVATGGVTYYLTAYSNYTPPFVSATINYLNSPDSDNVLISDVKTNYSNTAPYLPISTQVLTDGNSNLLTSNTILSRDSFGNILESQDASGIYASTLFDYNNLVPVAQVLNANNGESGYTGIENNWEDLSKGWETGGSQVSTAAAHTGSYSALSNNDYGPSKNFYVGSAGISLSRSYIMQAWIKIISGTCTIDISRRDNLGNAVASDVATTLSSGSGWQQISVTITPSQLSVVPSNGYLRVFCGFIGTGNEGYVDDVRFLPIDAQMTTITYDPFTLQVTSKSDANGIPVYYQYDSFGRLVQTNNSDGTLLSQTSYYLSRAHNADSFNLNDPNYTQTSSYPNGPSSTPLIKSTFTDGLGRAIQTHQRNSPYDIVTAVEYDNSGRQYHLWKPYSTSTLNYDPNFATEAQSLYGITNPYTEEIYYTDPLSRIQYEKPAGWTSNYEWTEYQYGSTAINSVLLFYTDKLQTVGSNTGQTDTRVYTDNLGRAVRTETFVVGSTTKLASSTVYNMLGNPVQTTDPNGNVSTNQYDFLGHLTQQTTVENGTTQNLYDQFGRLRFMLDADGAVASPNNILYWKYDNLGRVIEKGYFNNQTWSTTAQNVNNESFPSTPATWRKKYDYDDASVTPYFQGRLCKVQTNNGNTGNVDVEETFQYDKFGNNIVTSDSVVGFASEKYSTSYDYDYLGRVTQIYYPAYKVLTSLQNITVGTGSENDASSPTTMTVGSAVTVQNGGTMNLDAKQGITLTPGFTAATGSNFKATTGMVIKYTYNQLGQVSGVGNNSNSNYFGNYSYNADGTLNQERTNNLTSVTNYSYNARSFPTSISNNNFTESLAYSNTNTYYNGSIASTSFSYGAGGPTSYNYTYQYDQNNRMTSAVNSVNSSYNYTNIQYDNDGNVTNRWEGNNQKTFSYTNNKPTEYILNQNNPNNGGSWSLQYDADGNLISNQHSVLTAGYDPFTLLTQTMTQGGNQINYQYDGSKERILKTVNGTKTLYLRGTNDYPLTEKTSGNVNRFYVYGPTGLISLIDNGTSYFVLKDHLGSTRVVLNSSSAPVTWYDYTPYGNMWRSTISEDAHYRFTGQEYDPETNLFNFRARMYDGTLGIFYAGDPAGQGFSSYMYAGGNPVIYVDKDGRWFGIDDLIISAVSFVTGYLSNALTTNQWGIQSLRSGAEDAIIADLAYNTGGAAAGVIAEKGSAAYAITSATIGGAVGGFSGGAVSQLDQNGWNFGNLNWTSISNSTLSGAAGGLAGGITGQLRGSPILPGIVGGAVGGGVQSSLAGGNFLEGAFNGGWWGGFGAALTAEGYNVYGEYLTNKYLQENAFGKDIERASITTGDPSEYNCKDFYSDLQQAGLDLPGVGFGDPTIGYAHVGFDLGGDMYGNRYILSKLGAAFPIEVNTARSLSTGSWLPSGFYYKGVYFNQSSGAYGPWRYLSGR